MIEPIRVLHILQRMEAGGIQSFLMNIYRSIDRNRIQFDFLVHYKEDEFYDEEIRLMGGNIYKFSVREDYNVSRYKKELRNFFNEHKEYHIVHGHMETLSNIWEKEAKRAKVSTIISHSHTAGFNESNPIKLLIKEYFRCHYGINATKLFACSNSAGNFMFKQKKFDVIPNAIDISKFQFSYEKRLIRESLGIEDEFVIGHVGRFHPSKNHSFILDIAEELMKSIPNIKILLVGDGDTKKHIEDEILRRNLDGVVLLLGNRNDINLLYSAMDAFIMPSLFEGLPLVGVEAQASGLPCIFSDKITNELSITDLAEFISIDFGVSNWVLRLIAISHEEREREQYASIVGEQGYDIKVLSNKLVSIYESAGKEETYD